MATKVACDGCGEAAQHTVNLNPYAFPNLLPRQEYDEDGDPIYNPGGYLNLPEFGFDFCGKEECFKGLAAEQKLRIDTLAEKRKKGK